MEKKKYTERQIDEQAKISTKTERHTGRKQRERETKNKWTERQTVVQAKNKTKNK